MSRIFRKTISKIWAGKLGNLLFTIPKFVFIGSIIVFLCIMLNVILTTRIGGNAANVLFVLTIIITSYTLATVTILSIVTRYKDQGRIKKAFKLVTAVLFLGMASLLSIMWGKVYFKEGDIFGAGLLSLLFLKSMGIICGVWVVNHVVICLFTSNQVES